MQLIGFSPGTYTAPTPVKRPVNTVRFGMEKESQPAKAVDTGQGPSFFKKLRVGAGAGFRQAIDKKGLWQDTMWAVAFSVAGLILPGSQLLLIPASYAIGMTLRFLHGMSHAFRSDTKTAANGEG